MSQSEASTTEAEWSCRGWCFDDWQWECIRCSALPDTSGLELADDMTRPFGELENGMVVAMYSALCLPPSRTGMVPCLMAAADQPGGFYTARPKKEDHSLGCLMAAYRRKLTGPVESVFIRMQACLLQNDAEAGVGDCCASALGFNCLGLTNVSETQAQGLLCAYTYITALLMATALDDGVLLEKILSRFERLWERVHRLLLTGVDEPSWAV